ncbi:hypothetical protein GCM10009762_22930 [Dermacoccus barathri]|uniref:Secreted protein n=1 Tax=Dermacoccus barathri TaxID=322601 RepID=A0ABN2BXV0_9MICO
MVPVASMTAVTGVVSVLPLVRDVACVPRVRIFPVAGRGGRDGVPAVGGRVCGVAVVVLMRVRVCHCCFPCPGPALRWWPAQEAGLISLSTTHLWLVIFMPPAS